MKSSPVHASLSISGLARAVGLEVETVCFYERRGLIERPAQGDSP